MLNRLFPAVDANGSLLTGLALGFTSWCGGILVVLGLLVSAGFYLAALPLAALVALFAGHLHTLDVARRVRL